MLLLNTLEVGSEMTYWIPLLRMVGEDYPANANRTSTRMSGMLASSLAVVSMILLPAHLQASAISTPICEAHPISKTPAALWSGLVIQGFY